jgi:thioredoxin reductase
MSAALTLARARHNVLVVDAGRQSNLAATGIRSLLGHDGQAPADYSVAGRSELLAYPSVDLHRGTVTRGVREEDGGFAVVLDDGRRERARAMVLAPGMEYRYPQLPGMDERWGRSMLHCPFCQGWKSVTSPWGARRRFGSRARVTEPPCLE